MCHKFLFLLAGILGSFLVNASTFHHVSTDTGLDHPFVRDIAQGADGRMWIATLKGVSLFDGYEIKKLTGEGFVQLSKVVSMQPQSGSSVMVVGTAELGVYLTDGVTIKEVEWLVPEPTDSLSDVIAVGEDIWLFYPNTIFILQQSKVTMSLVNPIERRTYSALYDVDSGFVWVAGTDHVYQVDVDSFDAQKVPIKADSPNRRKLALVQDQRGQLWLGRSDGLYRFDKACGCFVPAFDLFEGMEITDLVSINQQLWIATPVNGLHMYDFSTQTRKHFQKGQLAAGQISDNSIMNLYAGDNDMLWLGTFNDGINYADTKTLVFNLMYNQHAGLACSPGTTVYDVYEHPSGSLWLATDQGLVSYQPTTMGCESYVTTGLVEHSPQAVLIYSIFPVQPDLFWLNTSNGLLSFDLANQQFRSLGDSNLLASNYFISETDSDNYYLGASDGLYLMDESMQILQKIPIANSEDSTMLIDKHIITTTGHKYFGARTGLYKLSDDQLNPVFVQPDNGEMAKHITGLVSDDQGGYLLASEELVLVHVDHEGKPRDLSGLFQTENSQPLIYEMIWIDDELWLSSDVGIFRLNSAFTEVQHFGPQDGSINGGFIKKSSHLGESGTIYFGGKQGLVAFKPEYIKLNEKPPEIVFTEINQLNKPLTIGGKLLGGFKLDQDANQLKSIPLNHRDLAIGFEFAALDYASPQNNQYAFRLLGFNDTWNTVDARNRTATYTNLDPGDYTFEVKAANKDGIWTDVPRSLAITVKPAPWFSPWAYALYALTFTVAVLSFIRHRTASARKRAVELEVVVNERTQELKTQKQMVESLLDHKNELFANVTHEFKTPLALIKGPAEQLISEAELYPHKSKLKMIKRNANRLLVMVGQILKLSEVEQEQAVVRENQAVQPVLNMLFEAYRILADDKNINLKLNNQSEAQIYASVEFLDMVVGNLLSNAIKFTPAGGTVTLSSADEDDHVLISVKDTGSGIAEADQQAVFERFTRLDSHRNIQGTGIGLAVVKEITQANGGRVTLNSQLGQGSEFIINMPQAEWQSVEEHDQLVVADMVENTANELLADELPTTTKHKTAAVKLLVIEDNLDMRTHIGEILKDHYQCLFADRGKVGIAIALKEMPDIIICDVMMPEMDGFQVTRILRQDAQTSHIPIILLTALNTKESRIKGWRENIDVYLTKPFDAQELNATLGAILNVRKILQQKTQESLSVSGTTEALDLPKQDLKFVNKLKTAIAENYHDIMFMRPQLAALMAVSERQLQRKVKALIDDTPMNLLRHYRLEMAAQKLTDGLQVSLVGDACGFSSVSYFAACFKKQYGMTPKKYQMTVNKKS